MIVYLTSSPGGQYKVDGKRMPTSLNPANGFVDSLKKNWKKEAKVVLISAEPDIPEINDSIKSILEQSFPMSELSVKQIDICDSRDERVVARLAEYDVIILSGGHVPTQNRFFHKIHLKEELQKFDGILIGISAGTMNSASVVYAQPELEGESVDTKYQRFLDGLSLTELMILPHYQDVKEETLDGKRVMEDITYPDSIGREFYAISDGSYILIENGKQTLYGEGYRIKNGVIQQICEDGNSVMI